MRIPDKTNVWTPAANTHVCPSCGSHDTRKSFTSGAFDTVIRMFNCLPYRCRKCAKRFIRRIPKDDQTDFLPVVPGESEVHSDDKSK